MRRRDRRPLRRSTLSLCFAQIPHSGLICRLGTEQNSTLQIPRRLQPRIPQPRLHLALALTLTIILTLAIIRVRTTPTHEIRQQRKPNPHLPISISVSISI